MSVRERVWEDIGIHAIATQVQTHAVDFRVYEIVIPDYGGLRAYHRTAAPDLLDLTTSVAEAEVYLYGTVKWDGCSDFWLGEDGYYHFCGVREAERIGVILRRLYLWVEEIMPNFDVPDRSTTAQRLARAVLEGDDQAAGLLADKVLEGLAAQR